MSIVIFLLLWLSGNLAYYFFGGFILYIVKNSGITLPTKWENLNLSAFVIIFSTIVPFVALIIHCCLKIYSYGFATYISGYKIDYCYLLFNSAQICWLALPFQIAASCGKKNIKIYLIIARWIIIFGIVGTLFNFIKRV